MVKKIVALVFVLGVIGGIVAGCSGGGDTGPAPATGASGANTGGGASTTGGGSTTSGTSG